MIMFTCDTFAAINSFIRSAHKSVGLPQNEIASNLPKKEWHSNFVIGLVEFRRFL